MAHFAELGLDNIVLRVIVINNNELLDENGQETRFIDWAIGKNGCRLVTTELFVKILLA